MSCTSTANHDASVIPAPTTEAVTTGLLGDHRSRETVVFTKIMHRQYEGRELFVDDVHRGALPIDAVLKVGAHRMEILVGPADRLSFDIDLAPHPGVFVLQLGDR